MPVPASVATETVDPAVAAAAAASQDPADNLDNFAAAFEQLSKLGEKPVTDDAMQGKPVKTEDEIAAEAAAATPADGDLPPTAEEQIAANEAEEAAAAEAAKAAQKQPVSKPQVQEEDRLEKFVDKLADRLAPPKPAPQASTPEPEYTPQEQAFLTNYAKEFPDVAKAEALIRRAEYGHVVKFVFDQMGGKIAQLEATIAELSTKAQLSELTESVEDYSDVRDKVIAWVDEQPGYLKAAYQQVVKHGTADEVVDLINRWRQATGTPLQTPAAQATTSLQKDTELPAAAKQAAAKLAPVGSKRGATASAGPSNDDFEGAFKEFASAKE